MTQSDVVLFMKGVPDAPRCGFSRRIVGLLREQGVQFSSFDILQDESVRQGLKVLNDWPTFPQLIVKGEFVGGLDVVKEMVDNGELKELLAQPLIARGVSTRYITSGSRSIVDDMVLGQRASKILCLLGHVN